MARRHETSGDADDGDMGRTDRTNLVMQSRTMQDGGAHGVPGERRLVLADIQIERMVPSMPRRYGSARAGRRPECRWVSARAARQQADGPRVNASETSAAAEQNGAGNRDNAQDRVNCRSSAPIEDRHPGQIQECCEPAVPDEVAESRDVRMPGAAFGHRIGDCGRGTHGRRPAREGPIAADAHAIEDGGAQAVEAGIDRQHETPG